MIPSNPIFIKDIIGDIVKTITPTVLPIIQANEAAAFNRPTMIDTINYQHGTADELIQTLAQDDKSVPLRKVKYPLIWLVQDFAEKRGQQVGFYASPLLNIVIAHQTADTYKAYERYKYVFGPVLYPIYYYLLQGIVDSDMTNDYDTQLLKHTKWDRLYWGRQAVGGNTANKLNDYVDAIDITNLEVTILNNNC